MGNSNQAVETVSRSTRIQNTRMVKENDRRLVSTPAPVTLFSSSTPGTYPNIIVPQCVTQLNFTIVGGSGGTGTNTSGGIGYGASITGTLAVTPGDVLNLTVGANGGSTTTSTSPGVGGSGAGHGGDGDRGNGGGGGGSEIFNSSNPTSFVIAGAAGGTGSGTRGGDAGSVGSGGSGGAPGTQTGPGLGSNGTSGSGMNGGNAFRNGLGGGGGGGYFGGAGSTNAAGGGGGSSWTSSPGTTVSTSGLDATATPQIVLTYTPTSQVTLFSSNTPGPYSVTVPQCVTSLNFTVVGGSGGASDPTYGTSGGKGASIAGTLAVTPGDVLNLTVGANGGPAVANGGLGNGGSGAGNGGSAFTGASTGGGGGGGSTVFDATNPTVFVVAGAGGGGGTNTGGNGGDAGQPGSGTSGGGAGTQTGPGVSSFGPLEDGSGMNGGSQAYSRNKGAGGGGGGYFGGAAGAGGGGGGSSWTSSTGTTVSTSGLDATSTPQIILTYSDCGSCQTTLPITVSKTANTEIDTTYTWNLSKTVDQPNVTLATGGTATVNYTVTATPQAETDTYTVYGTIAITNPNPPSSLAHVLIDSIQDPTGTSVSGGPTLPYDLPPGQTLNVNYSYTVGSPVASGTNTATVMAHVEQPLGTTTIPSYSTTATATYTFSPPTIDNITHNTVIIEDSLNNAVLGQTSWPAPATFYYPATIGPYSTCGSYTVNNVAELLSPNPNGNLDFLGSTAVPVNVTVGTAPTLTVTKTANTEVSRMYEWTISKTANPSTLALAPGGTAPVNFTVQVNPNGYIDSNPEVYGTVTISNPDTSSCARTMSVNSMTDSLPGTQFQPAFSPFTLAPGQSVTFDYSTFLPSETDGTNSVTVNASWSGPDAGSAAFTASAPYSFVSPTTINPIDQTVTITDNDPAYPVLGTTTYPNPRTFTYTDTIGPYANCGTYNFSDTVNVVGDGNAIVATASANVMINVSQTSTLTVTKTADTEVTRTYKWAVTKKANPAAVTLKIGLTAPVAYTVVVTPVSYTDSNMEVYGNIVITNSNSANCGQPIKITSIKDSLSGAVLNTPTLPYILAPGASITVPYYALVADETPGTNTVTVMATTGSTSNTYTASAPYSFTSPAVINPVNATVTINDSVSGILGSTTWQNPKTFNYNANVGPIYACGKYTANNTVNVIGSGSAVIATASAAVAISIPCNGCVLSQGYWKNHLTDPSWTLLSSKGPNTVFFLSGKTYIQVLNTPPGGNPYYTLAVQFIGAQLNILEATDPTAIAATMTGALALFQKYTPAQVLALSHTSTDYKNFAIFAATLAGYNTGTLRGCGVPTCNGSRGSPTKESPERKERNNGWP